jgi:hypothetical protein
MLDVFPTAGRQSLTAMSKMRLKVFRVWAVSHVQEDENDDQIVNLDDFTLEVCIKVQRKIALKKKEKTGDGTKSTYSGTLYGFSGKMRDWTTAN